MQTSLADFIRDTPQGKEADAILRKCVHCGFCTATCPTYQLLGDELDGPRGRIYLIKQVLEGRRATERTQRHLDRCLTCRACETTCPSGVRYGRLADIGRELVERQVGRAGFAALKRKALNFVLPRPALFDNLLLLGRLARPLLPAALQRAIPKAGPATTWPPARHPRRMLVLQGCVQPALAPNINCAAARLLDRAGISLVAADAAGCCGAVSFHLTEQAQGLDYVRRNVDAWWPHVEAGAEAIVTTASGCGAMVKEYGHLLAHDPAYAARAARVSALARDIGEIVTAEQDRLLALATGPAPAGRIAFHSPCTLQHGLALRGVVETLLERFGFELAPVPDAHLCCGSAGTYSILEPELAGRLRANKIRALASGAPRSIATANIGCLGHLQAATELPVRHWVELLDEALMSAPKGTA
ncbi:MAG TPA: glycolate oxidase subunit GlcF [Burkholderiales bacterium]|nr:glycolate oxidase subunit GlcF [Burkholderiales bacterium]